MPLSLQAKLLRVLENGEVSRIGSNDSLKVDVRLIAATNKNLDTMIAEGKFRQDLYYRLRVGTLRLPPLRKRKKDIPLLVTQFLRELTTKHGKKVNGVSDAAWKAFTAYEWPGNVRELKNHLESMLLQDTDGILGMDDVGEGDGLKPSEDEPMRVGVDHLTGRPLSEVERYYMERALELTNGNRTEASKMLGIGERTLYRAMLDWKLQDQIKEAMTRHGNDLALAAAELGMTAETLEKKLKKLGQHGEDEG